MAYEHMTYEAILSRMIERVTAKYPNLDTREGSLIFNALAPAAVELAIMYTELDNVLSESFVGTATREYLLIACEQMGMDISSFDANAGVHKAEFDVEVPIGSRWNCDLYNYAVAEFIEKNAETQFYEYKLVYYGYSRHLLRTQTSDHNVVKKRYKICDAVLDYNRNRDGCYTRVKFFIAKVFFFQHYRILLFNTLLTL